MSDPKRDVNHKKYSCTAFLFSKYNMLYFVLLYSVLLYLVVYSHNLTLYRRMVNNCNVSSSKKY